LNELVSYKCEGKRGSEAAIDAYLDMTTWDLFLGGQLVNKFGGWETAGVKI
jgi:hypothetical protein